MKVELAEFVDELSDGDIKPRGRRKLYTRRNILGSGSSLTLIFICPIYGMGSLSSFLELGAKSNDLMKCPASVVKSIILAYLVSKLVYVIIYSCITHLV